MSHEPSQAFSISVHVAWGDMDAFGHVNNIMYLRYAESARVALLDSCGWFRPHAGKAPPPGATTVGPILHSVQCRFRAPVTYPDVLSVSAFVTDLAHDRVTIAHELTSRALGKLAAEVLGIVVAFDYQQHAKAIIPPDVSSALRRHWRSN